MQKAGGICWFSLERMQSSSVHILFTLFGAGISFAHLTSLFVCLYMLYFLTDYLRTAPILDFCFRTPDKAKVVRTDHENSLGYKEKRWGNVAVRTNFSVLEEHIINFIYIYIYIKLTSNYNFTMKWLVRGDCYYLYDVLFVDLDAEIVFLLLFLTTSYLPG